jgi:hypothetical protein
MAKRREPFQIVVKRARFVTALFGIGAQFYLGNILNSSSHLYLEKNNRGKSQFLVLLLFLIISKVDKLEKTTFFFRI